MMLRKILPATFLSAIALLLVGGGSLYAEPHANDRIALAISGPNCSIHQETIARTLSQIPGVRRIDMTLIEGHILIDRIHDQRTAADFQAIINSILPADGQCRAEVMESCISAGPPPSAASQQ